MTEGIGGQVTLKTVVRVHRTPASAIQQWDAEFAEAQRVILERLEVLEREGEALKGVIQRFLAERDQA